MAEQGRFTYRLDVENNRALKNLTDFAKTSAKTRQRVERDIKAQVRANTELDKSIIKQRGELSKLRAQYRKDTVGKKASAEAAAKTGDEIDKLTQDIHENTEALRQGKRAIRGFQAELDKLDTAQKRRNRGVQQYRNPIGPMPAQRGFGGNTGFRAGIGGAVRAGGGGGGMIGAAVAGGVAGIAAAVATRAIQAVEDLAVATVQYADAAAKAAAESQKLDIALKGTLGREDAEKGLQTIKEVVDDYNVPFNTAIRQFTRFAASAKATGVGADDIEESFKGLIAANKALGGSQEQANGILLAATQVFGKGKVSAEELRGQIGERLPGAVAMFAKATNRTTAELDKGLEQGVVSVEEFVQFTKGLFNDFDEQAQAIGDSPAEAGARLANELDKLQRSIGALLMPIGAEFQKVFAEIVGYINAAITALNNFLGLGTEGAKVKAKRDIENETATIARLSGTVDIAEDGTVTRKAGDKGGRALSRYTQAVARLKDAEARLDKALGPEEGTIEQGTMVTSEDLQKNRAGSGGKGPNLAKIRAANARRLAQETARQVMALDKQRFDLLRRLRQEDNRLAEANLTGQQRAALAIVNTAMEQNAAIDEQVRVLDAAVDKAQANLKAAKAELDAANNDADRIRAQGRVDIAGARLAGAQDQRAQFGESEGQLRANVGGTALAGLTEGFRSTTADAQLQLDQLRERNRLMMEGFSPEQIEGMMRTAEIERNRLDIISQLNPQMQGYSDIVADINAKAAEATNAVNALTQAQEDSASGLEQYVNSSLQYVGDLKARFVDMAQTIEGGLSTAIESVLTGTKTIGQAFQGFFADIGKAFLQMASQMIAKLIIISLLSAATGMPMGQLMGGGGNGGGGGGLFGFLGGLFGGGKQKKMAKGGIVTGPTNALIGEGGMNEAVVPLPDGKSIPISMGKKGMGGNVNTNITVNVDQGGGTSTDMDGDGANKLGKAIDSAVKRVIMDERRSGGLLYNGRR